jgi:putative phosphoesterase
MILGLISDTHGLLRPGALRAMSGADLIIHAGDVGNPEILEALKKIAPVVAVRGNVDGGEWADGLPATVVTSAGPTKIYVLHDVKELNPKLMPPETAIVVSGHSHKPGQVQRNDILYINPGSAGPRRFNLPISAARLNLDKKPWLVEFLDVSKP